MKFFIATLVLASFNLFAAELEVFEINANRTSGKHSISSTYGHNEELGRAWVEIEVASGFTDSDSDSYRTKVSGLSLQGDSIVLDVEGKQVECAHLVKRGIFGYKFPKATGLCQFVVKSKTVTEDNGFEVVMKKFYVVVLKTN